VQIHWKTSIGADPGTTCGGRIREGEGDSAGEGENDRKQREFEKQQVMVKPSPQDVLLLSRA